MLNDKKLKQKGTETPFESHISEGERKGSGWDSFLHIFNYCQIVGRHLMKTELIFS